MAISEELEDIECLSNEEGQRKDNSTILQPLLQHFLPIVLLQSCLYWLFLHIRGMVFKLFLPRTLTKSNNRSLVIDQVSVTTIWALFGKAKKLAYSG